MRSIRNWRAVYNTELAYNLPLPVRPRRVYLQMLRLLQQSQWWSSEELRNYQLEQLQRLLHHCYANVPYYRQQFTAIGFHPSDLTSLSQLGALPTINKSTLTESLIPLCATNLTGGRYYTTGGSTGIPVGFYIDEDVDMLRNAFFTRMWGWVGYRNYERGIVLRGTVINSDDPAALTRYDFLSNKLFVSTYHMKEGSLQRFYDIICRSGAHSVQAYPSAITPIAQHMIENKLPPIPSVRLILCGSENLYPWQRDLITRAFQCRVYTWYGHTENVLLAGECEHSSEYHCFAEHGIFELVRSDGSVIENDGEVGEIVGTGFLNYKMPFVRYRTADTASYAAGQCACGRAYRRIQSIDGRLQELLITADGRRISMTAINMHSDLFDRVKQFQFVQDVPGRVVMRIVRKPAYTESDSQRILGELKRKTGSDMVIDIEFVDDIPLTQRGKHRFLIQHLDVRFTD